MSAILDPRPVRALSVRLPNNDVVTAHLRRRARWANIVTANAMPVAVTLMLVWLATIGLVVLSDFVSLKLIVPVYMLPVVGVAAQWGILSALVAAATGAAAADFFFFPPPTSFWHSNPQPAFDLALLVFIAVVISNLATRLRSDEHTPISANATSEPPAFSQDLATCPTGGTLQAESLSTNQA